MANSWLRLWHDMPNDPKWRTISRVSKQSIPEVMAVYIHILVNASNATERGRTQNVCSEDIASALDLECEQVDAILAAMQGRVLEGDMVSGWSKRQVEREDGSAERAKAWREAKKQEKTQELNATERNRTQDERKQTPDTDTDTDTENPRSTSTVNKLTSVTPAGIVCGRLKSEARITDASPQHPKLIALLNAGLTDDEIVSAGHEACSKGKGFSYALAVAEGRRRDASNIKPLPAKSVGGLSRAGQSTADAAARWLESEGAQA